MLIRTMEDVMRVARTKKNMKLMVCAAEELEAIAAAHKAREEGLAEPVFIGNKKKIIEIAKQANIDVEKYQIEDYPNQTQAALRGVSMVSKGEGDVLMKGLINTTPFLQAVLDKNVGLRTGRRLSHVGYFKVHNYPKFLFMTDGGMNIAPDLETKVSIIKNAIDLTNAFGQETPKVAIMSAVETVTLDIPSTIEAAILSKMGDSEQIPGCIIDGPMTLDVAISTEAAKLKNIKSRVAGDADILVVPDIETGNIFVKSLMYYCNAGFGGLILGARAPVVVTSRSDPTEESKLWSIAGAMILADYLKGKVME